MLSSGQTHPPQELAGAFHAAPEQLCRAHVLRVELTDPDGKI